MEQPLLTIFTPTYNRAHTLNRLFESLQAQSLFSFEWLVIDDGSTDNTSALFDNWLKDNHDFQIRYYRVDNGGKNRALNRALKLAKGRYFMILDSDDMLTADAVAFVCEKIKEVEHLDNFIGISGKRADLATGKPIGMNEKDYSEEGYIDCSNLERAKYGLHRDMAEVFITSKLQKYEFKVWKNEKFAPEEIVWHQMALDGYKLRWFNKITYLCEYQEGGLTNSTWRLLHDNPMGYAMMFNQRLQIDKTKSVRMQNALQYDACCWLAGEVNMICKSHMPWLTLILAPFAWMLAARRKQQFKRLIK